MQQRKLLGIPIKADDRTVAAYDAARARLRAAWRRLWRVLRRRS